MFEFVRSHNRVLFFVMVLLIFPSFAFFGVQGYSRFNDPAGDAVAKVDGQKITRAEWDAAHKRQIEQMRDRAPNVDVKLFDTPEMRRSTLDSLLRERVLFAAATRGHLSASDERLMRELQSVPQLAALRRADGSFDVAAYRALVEARGQSTESFEAGVRQELSLREVLSAVSETPPAMPAAARSALDALLQQREVQVQRFEAKDHAAGLNPDDAALVAYLKAHESEFRAPEQASIEYVMLDVAALEKGVPVPAESELRKYYDENAARYTAAEERRASHILIAAPKDAPADQRAKAKTQAESLLAELRKNAAAFADLAKKHSSDTLSAERGGDLDFFGRGAMVKPFEDAAYAMKPGEIGNLVETEFGFHIIRLDAVRGGTRKPFEQVRPEIEAEAKRQAAAKRFAEVAEQFTNLVVAKADSLSPVAETLKLAKQTATVQRTPAAGAAGALASPKFLEAVFAADALKNKLNTEAIDIGANQLAAARVLEHKPARAMALDEVRAQVRERVIAEQSAARARQAGEAKLAELKRKDSASALPAAVTLSRANPQGQPRALIDAVMRADAGKLPQWLGVDLGGQGYAVARVAAVKPPAADSAEVVQLTPRYAQAWAGAESQAYYKALERRYKAAVTAAAAASAPTP